MIKLKNYSLIELMVAMGVFAFMMVLLMNFFGSATDVLDRESTRAEKIYEGGICSKIMNQDFSTMVVDSGSTPTKEFGFLKSEHCVQALLQKTAPQFPIP